MGLRHGRRRLLCEVLEGLADPHAGPVESPSQGDENQEQQHGPRGVDPLVGLSLRPRSSLREREEGDRGEINESDVAQKLCFLRELHVLSALC